MKYNGERKLSFEYLCKKISICLHQNVKYYHFGVNIWQMANKNKTKIHKITDINVNKLKCWASHLTSATITNKLFVKFSEM